LGGNGGGGGPVGFRGLTFVMGWVLGG